MVSVENTAPNIKVYISTDYIVVSIMGFLEKISLLNFNHHSKDKHSLQKDFFEYTR